MRAVVVPRLPWHPSVRRYRPRCRPPLLSCLRVWCRLDRRYPSGRFCGCRRLTVRSLPRLVRSRDLVSPLNRRSSCAPLDRRPSRPLPPVYWQARVVVRSWRRMCGFARWSRPLPCPRHFPSVTRVVITIPASSLWGACSARFCQTTCFWRLAQDWSLAVWQPPFRGWQPFSSQLPPHPRLCLSRFWRWGSVSLLNHRSSAGRLYPTKPPCCHVRLGLPASVSLLNRRSFFPVRLRHYQLGRRYLPCSLVSSRRRSLHRRPSCVPVRLKYQLSAYRVS